MGRMQPDFDRSARLSPFESGCISLAHVGPPGSQQTPLEISQGGLGFKTKFTYGTNAAKFEDVDGWMADLSRPVKIWLHCERESS